MDDVVKPVWKVPGRGAFVWCWAALSILTLLILLAVARTPADAILGRRLGNALAAARIALDHPPDPDFDLLDWSHRHKDDPNIPEHVWLVMARGDFDGVRSESELNARIDREVALHEAESQHLDRYLSNGEVMVSRDFTPGYQLARTVMGVPLPAIAVGLALSLGIVASIGLAWAVQYTAPFRPVRKVGRAFARVVSAPWSMDDAERRLRDRLDEARRVDHEADTLDTTPTSE